MFRFASSLSSKLRLAEKGIQRPVGGRLAWSRNYAGEDVKFSGPGIAAYDDKLSQMPEGCDVIDNSLLPCDAASYVRQVRNPACLVNIDELDYGAVSKYADVMISSKNFGVKKLVEARLYNMEFRMGVDKAFSAVKQHLYCRARMINKSEEIAQIYFASWLVLGAVEGSGVLDYHIVATEATNGDRNVGELVAKAINKVGKDGFFHFSGREKSNDVLEFFNGMKLQLACIYTCFCDKKKKTCDLENPVVLIHENNISNRNVVEQAITLAGPKRPVLIVAEGLEREAAGSLLVDKTGSQVCIIELANIQESRKEIMKDLAVFVGSEVFTGTSDFDSITPRKFGSCKKVMVSQTEMVILGGSGKQIDIENRCKLLRCLMKNNQVNEEVKMLERRLAKLSDNVAVFKIGRAGKTYKKVTVALEAARSAMEGGIVPGAGVALVHASKVLDKLEPANSAEDFAIRILKNALKMPVYSIATIAGLDGFSIVKKLLELDNPNFGYDLARGEYVDILELGIVDPLKYVIADINNFEMSLLIACEGYERTHDKQVVKARLVSWLEKWKQTDGYKKLRKTQQEFVENYMWQVEKDTYGITRE